MASRKSSRQETMVPPSIPEDAILPNEPPPPESDSCTSSGSDGENHGLLDSTTQTNRFSLEKRASIGTNANEPTRKTSTGSRKMSIRRRMSIPMEERINQQHEKDIDHALHDVSLQHTQVQAVEKKDFALEVRGTRDINNFLQKSEVFLDLAETDLSNIVDKMLTLMTKDPKETVTKEELKSLIFTNDTQTVLSESIQGTVSRGKQYDWEQAWLCSAVNIPTLKRRHVGIARLKHRCNLGQNAEEISFFILILCPSEVKKTKSALETGRTFATLFSDVGLRHQLLTAQTIDEFKESMRKATTMFAEHQGPPELNGGPSGGDDGGNKQDAIKWFHIGRGIKHDLMGRLPYYLDDYKDGIIGPNSIQKTISTTLFLYFSVILPAVALGVLNSANTHGAISVQQVIVGQTIGAITFTLLAGQPLVVVMTTAPLALFIKIIFSIAEDFEIDFLAFYAMTGLWNTFFLILYSFCNMSVLMKYSSRSTEEIFSNFITIAFITDSTKNMVKTFNQHYWSENCASDQHAAGVEALTSPLAVASSNITGHAVEHSMECHPDVCFLSLILMLGTLWLGVTLFDFTKTPFLNKRKREILSDYALPVSVVVFSLIGTILFSGVQVKTFPYKPTSNVFQVVNFAALSVGSVFGAMGLGFSLSLLFFMDQNISAAMVNSPDNKLQKGNAYHWDLLVVGLINAFLCIFGLPFLHAVLPHSPLHVKCLADTEERVENGYVRDIVVWVRETRLTNLFSNILIGISMLFLGFVLTYIPTPVLDGLFLYLAITALYGNQMFERISLLFMEQSAYPPNHYIRQVPQRKIHLFTACQCCQLLILCAFGFAPWPYAKMIFPLVILVFLPIRHIIIPLFVEKKYLDVLDGH